MSVTSLQSISMDLRVSDHSVYFSFMIYCFILWYYGHTFSLVPVQWNPSKADTVRTIAVFWYSMVPSII